LEALPFGEKVWRLIAPVHYRIPEFVYVCAVLAIGGSVVLGAMPLFPVAVPLMAIGTIGVVRWHQDRRAARGGLVVPIFSAPDGVDARDFQRTMMASLYAKLSPEEAKRVRAVSVTVGPDERDFAVRLRRRLRAAFVLYGRISDQGASVYPSILEPISRRLLHIDPHTREALPEKATWRSLFTDLASTHGVADQRYPFTATSELEAVLQGQAGTLALAQGDHERASRLLRQALGSDPDSRSHAVDALRAKLAVALAEQDKDVEALDVLRGRATELDAAPELLRMYAALKSYGGKFPFEGAQGQQNRAEVVRALRQAANDRADPQRPQTLYNLAQLLAAGSPDDVDEAERILAELFRSNSHYRKAWYVARDLGGRAWEKSRQALAAGHADAAGIEIEKAAKMYSLAIRRRPRVQFYMDREAGGLGFGFFTVPRSGIMHANAFDAHREAGHSWRARWHNKKAVRVVNKSLAAGDKGMARGDFPAARSAYERGIVGWRDEIEVQSRVFAAAACLGSGDADAAMRWWEEAKTIDRIVAMQVRDGQLPQPMRGRLPD
jgi:tetratricopeptide (TPR) repeat protein